MTKAEAVTKLLNVAKAEVGYREGSNNYTKYAENPGITKLYGWTPQYQPWCCTFVNWCFITAFGYDLGSKLTYGGTAACSNSASLFKNNGAYVTSPEPGDQAFFYASGGINHTGIVMSVSGNSFQTIEGNYSDKVSIVTHNVIGNDVAGFGRPNWKLVEGQSASAAPATSTTTTTAKDDTDHKWTPPTLNYSNAYSSDCVVLQALLNVRHFPCGSVDGFFGPKTQGAVNKAKQFYGMEANGRCDLPLWKKLLGG